MHILSEYILDMDKTLILIQTSNPAGYTRTAIKRRLLSICDKYRPEALLERRKRYAHEAETTGTSSISLQLRPVSK